ncbi:WbqC family protein [Hydrogenivirga sp.]
MRKVVISQPRYLPHISYIQRLYFADIFVFLDNVQRQYLGVENRNKIIINGKVKWLTIPVSSSRKEKIYKAKISGISWIDKHKRILIEAYKKHPYFSYKLIEAYYKDAEKVLLKTDFSYADTLIHLVLNCCEIFGFRPEYLRATELNVPEVKGVENLYNVVKNSGGDIYISGSNGRTYGVKEYFEERGIKVLFHDPSDIRYNQHGVDEFIPFLCFFDTIFNIGLDRTRELILQEPILNED